MSGYTLEVPTSNAEVKNNSNNYNTYLDTEYDLNIKTWACKDIDDVNGTMNASAEMATQIGENMGTNVTYNNITLMNKSGTYTYYDVDTDNSCIILITSKNLNTIKHILETMTKSTFDIKNSPFKLDSNGLTLNDSNNDATSNQVATSKKTSTAKKSNSNQKSSGSDSYYYSGNPEANGEFEGVGEAVYRNTKTGKIYVEHGRGNLQRAPELDYVY